MSTVINQTPASGAPVEDGRHVVVTEPVRSNVMGLVALGLAIVGFILAALLLTAGIAWILLLPALILGAVALTLKNRRKGAALAAVIIALVALVLSFVGFRLPLGADGQAIGAGVVNNAGVNPLSTLTGGSGGAGQLANTGGGGATSTSADGVTVAVDNVDCHTPLATVTGLNITGEVCAVSVVVTNNGSDVVNIGTDDITANAGGTGYVADASLGEDSLVDLQVGAGESSTGLVYVNVPSGTGSLDSLTVSADDLADITVDLGR
ncbi:hypothetical protein BH09ACT5_BH09ACT5_17000 [soil metagenome]